MSGNDENQITDLDRQIADAIARKFGHEPDYEYSARTRRGLESAAMYEQVHGLSYAAGMALVVTESNERYAIEQGRMTPELAQAIAEVRRLAWAGAEPNELMEPMMAMVEAMRS